MLPDLSKSNFRKMDWDKEQRVSYRFGADPMEGELL